MLTFTVVLLCVVLSQAATIEDKCMKENTKEKCDSKSTMCFWKDSLQLCIKIKGSTAMNDTNVVSHDDAKTLKLFKSLNNLTSEALKNIAFYLATINEVAPTEENLARFRVAIEALRVLGRNRRADNVDKTSHYDMEDYEATTPRLGSIKKDLKKILKVIKKTPVSPAAPTNAAPAAAPQQDVTFVDDETGETFEGRINWGNVLKGAKAFGKGVLTGVTSDEDQDMDERKINWGSVLKGAKEFGKGVISGVTSDEDMSERINWGNVLKGAKEFGKGVISGVTSDGESALADLAIADDLVAADGPFSDLMNPDERVDLNKIGQYVGKGGKFLAGILG